MRTPPKEVLIFSGGRRLKSRDFGKFQQIAAGIDVLYEVSRNLEQVSPTSARKDNEFDRTPAELCGHFFCTIANAEPITYSNKLSFIWKSSCRLKVLECFGGSPKIDALY